MVEPAQFIGVIMFSFLALGGLAQFMQSQGGRIARATPVIVLGLLMLMSLAGMVVLSSSLSSEPNWRPADPGESAADV